MNRIFGKPKKKDVPVKPTASNPPSVDPSIRTIGRLKKTVETLTKRQKLLDTKIKNELKKAAEFKRRDKKKQALMCLKKKKVYENENIRLGNSIFNMEQQIMTLESAHATSEMIEAQKEAKKAMKRIQEKTNIDSVQELQDDIQDQIAEMNEVNELLAEPNAVEDLDEQDLNDELDALLREDEESAELNIEPENISTTEQTTQDVPVAADGIDLPEAPEITKQQKEEQDDIAELQKLASEMAM